MKLLKSANLGRANAITLTHFRIMLTISFVMLAAAAAAYASGAGSLDLSFNGTGYKVDTFTAQPGFEGAYKTIVQPDGKILAGVAGYSLGRYNPDGSPDTSFGSGGKVVTTFGISFIQAVGDMALQPDGKIVVVGFRALTVPEDRRILVVRYNSDGTLDTAFGTNGSVVTYLDPTWMSCQASQVAIQPDGKIVVAGDMFNPASISPVAVIVRYNTDGTLDTTFDSDGIATTNAMDMWYGGSLVIQPDGKILAAGQSKTGSSSTSTFALVLFNTNGSLDTGFDGDGIVTTQMGANLSSVTTSLKVMPDGRIVAGGFTSNQDITDIDPALARYNANGSLDTSFNGNGKVLTHVTDNFDYLEDMAIQADGKIVATGAMGLGDITLLRYNLDGTLDNSYGTGGKVAINLGASEASHSVALDAGGRAVVVGYSPVSTLIARITAEAAPLVDVGGRVTNSFGQGISGLSMVLTGANGVSRYALTNGFGYYVFPFVASNEIYTINASSKRYTFLPEEHTVSLLGTAFDVDFTGTSNPETRVSAAPVKGSQKAAVKPVRPK